MNKLISGFKKLVLAVFLALALTLGMTAPASAEVTIYNQTDANSQPIPLTEWFGYFGSTTRLPRLAKDGVPVFNVSVTWTSADPSIATPSFSNNTNFVTGHAIGDVMFTATYQGESDAVTIKIRHSSRFMGDPVRTGLAPLLPGLSGITTSVSSEPLVGYPNSGGPAVPLEGRTVTFRNHKGDPAAICTAITGADGRATCNTFQVNSNDEYQQLSVEFNSDNTYGPTYAEIID